MSKNKSRKLISKRLMALIDGFIESYYGTHRKDLYETKDQFCNIVNKMSSERGIPATLKGIKRARLHFTRYIAGQPLLIADGVKLTKEGLPRDLNLLIKLIKVGDTPSLRFGLTLLTVSRSVTTPPITDLKPIESAWAGTFPISWDTCRSAVFRVMKLSKRKFKGKWFHSSTKSGPFGQAIMSCMVDFVVVLKNYPDLMGHWFRLAKRSVKHILDSLAVVENGISLAETIGKLTYKFPKKGEIPNLIPRKLSSFSDSEGKTRTIGILDYWSQNFLKPIHDDLMSLLRGIKEDCTFDQNSFISKLPKEGPYFSFDLTNATDRLPLSFQKEVMNQLYGKVVTEAGANILVSVPFSLKGHTEPIFYRCGQPMGGYSSGPAMAITHHVIVHLAATRAEKPPWGKYVLLGDDIVIADKDIAREYRAVMSELDVPISDAKTHVSNDTCEFAKRWIHKGVEITPYPLPAILTTGKRYYLLQNSLEQAERKGYGPLKDSTKGLQRLISLLGKPSQSERITKMVLAFDAIVNPKGEDNRDERLKETFTAFKLKDGMILPEPAVLRGNLDKIIKEQVRKDLDMLTEEVWKVAQYINDVASKYCRDISPLHPAAHVVNQVFDMKDQYLSRMLPNGFYKTTVKDLAEIAQFVPRVSMKIIQTRTSHLILASQSRLIKHLLRFCEKDTKYFETKKFVLKNLF